MAFVLLAPFIRINVLLVAFIRINVLLVMFGRIDVLMVMYNCTHGNINALCSRFIKLDKLLFGCLATVQHHQEAVVVVWELSP